MASDIEETVVTPDPAGEDAVRNASASGDRAKPAWRRFLEVAAPVAVFAVAAPFAVNTFATAVNSTVPAGQSSTEGADAAIAAETATTIATTAAATAVAPAAEAEPNVIVPASPVTSTTTLVAVVETPVSIEGVADDADDRTISLATEIVPADPTSADTSSAGTDDDATVDSPPATNKSASGEGHAHGDVTAEVALTRSERQALAVEVSIARDAAMQFSTVADAEAAGYKLVTGYLPLIGAHYIKWGLMEATFDPAAPEMLLYDGTEPTSSIVGLSYYLFSDTEPSPFSGANDHWHQHIGLCIKDGVVVGGERTTHAECAERGGVKAGAENGWMVHAWVVPGWESPQGLFSPEHIGLTADLPNS